LKGQLVAEDKRSALLYEKHLDRIGLVESAVLISRPGVHEGGGEGKGGDPPEVDRWWRKNVGGRNEEAYARSVLKRFCADDGPDIVIVVDKLLRDFDEPRNTALYIDRPLERHDLIQAAARVNRLHEARQWGLLVDYRGILKKLDPSIREGHGPGERDINIKDHTDITDITNITNITDITDHTGRTDLPDGLFHWIGWECKRLPELRRALLTILGSEDGEKDPENQRRLLAPNWREDESGRIYDAHQKAREDFHEALTRFSQCLELALGSRSFYEKEGFSRADVRGLKEDHDYFMDLWRTATRSARSALNYGEHEKESGEFANRPLKGEEVETPGVGYWADERKTEGAPEGMNEDELKVEADLIRARIASAIEHGMEDDPYQRQRFSELLTRTSADAASYDPLKRCLLFRDLEERVKNRRIDQIPKTLRGSRKARVYHGAFRLALGDDAFEKMKTAEKRIYTEQALAIDHVVKTAAAEHWLNPVDVEAEIRKRLLPRLFELLGMEKAREVIDLVIQIARASGDFQSVRD
ncbi:MAG: type I restriction endonuclease subunit R, partial [Desulfobacterales bacterium]|nr:type I restriction endonuclease subunit R [Desulfobacterales bacterium]